jgi:NAD(P)-dependent dehydrogenase (short-subunit alcohol dehydrogenase family)
VEALAQAAIRQFGKVDIVLNNATLAVLGAVKEVPIEKWDLSYRVNLRGPVLLARAFLPGMLGRHHGVFVCVSSTGTAYLGGYETFKAAQVHLANTLDAELEGTGVIAFTIGPGLAPTPTAQAAVARLAPLMGMTMAEFFEMNKGAVLSVEEAGAGFAAAIALAERFRGQEISSMQALRAACPGYSGQPEAASSTTAPAPGGPALALCQAVRRTLGEQSAGWKQRSLFERQWVIRDFKKTAGMPVEEWLAALQGLEDGLRAGGPLPAPRPPLEKLAGYYAHLADLARGYEKDAARLADNLKHIHAWQAEVEALQQALQSPGSVQSAQEIISR